MISNEWEKIHSTYENKAYRIIRKHIKKIVSKIPLENITFATTDATVRLNIDKNDFFAMYYQIYKTIGLIHGKETIRAIQKETKSISGFESSFVDHLQKWMMQNLGYRILLVSDTFINEIVKIIKDAYSENFSVQEIRTLIYKLVNSPDFYRWQAMRIARTETTTVANYSAMFAASQSKVVLDKVWLSIPDNRTRHRPEDDFDHRAMNGIKVGLYEKFNVNGNPIDYPGDQINGLAGNIINCRCTMQFVPRKDVNGFLIWK